MGNFSAKSIAVEFDSSTKKLTLPQLEEAYLAKLEKSSLPEVDGGMCNQLKDVIKTILEKDDLTYKELIMIEHAIGKKKKIILQDNPDLKLPRNRRNSSKEEAVINYSQRKINGRFYWYKQYTIDNKNVSEYIKDIKKEKIDINKSSITFHPDFSPTFHPDFSPKENKS